MTFPMSKVPSAACAATIRSVAEQKVAAVGGTGRPRIQVGVRERELHVYVPAQFCTEPVGGQVATLPPGIVN